MFEQLPASSVQGRVSDLLYRWRGIAEWHEVEAFVTAVTWTPDADLGEPNGHYDVQFFYGTLSDTQSGAVGINGLVGAPPYRVGESFYLRYDPKRPSRYYNANAPSALARTSLVLGAIGLGVVVSVLVIALLP